MAGKGPQLRKGANLPKFWENYDRIFRKKTVAPSQQTADIGTECLPPLNQPIPNTESSTEKRADGG